jgi:hypothetical protein
MSSGDKAEPITQSFPDALSMITPDDPMKPTRKNQNVGTLYDPVRWPLEPCRLMSARIFPCQPERVSELNHAGPDDTWTAPGTSS